MFVIFDELTQATFDRLYSSLTWEARSRKFSSAVLTDIGTADAMTYFSWMKHTLNSRDSVCIIADSWLRAKHNMRLELYQIRHLERWLLGRNGVIVSENPARLHEKVSLSVIDLTSNWITVDQLLELSYMNEGPGAGCWNPGKSILLVGERANHWGDMSYVSPFSALNRSGCSAWLTDQLAGAGISENMLYWVNAQREDQTWEDATFVAKLQPRRIVTLGSTAARWAKMNNLTADNVCHPQYHKRFHARDPYQLITVLTNSPS